MSQDAVDRFAAGKIQHVDEVIPAWIRIHGILVSNKKRRMETEILVNPSHFQGAIAKRGDSGLNVDKSAIGRKGLIDEGHVETERAERKDIENRLLA